ncbi:hypothetical protein CNMCM5793_007911 [Aspergillus hiratsukae]|uniref:Uncharacterized protein n=1 Tax=Aspergillus hiratsukae TaxID=1194566 RepID=A0A8H6UBW6_9EURO|nr:hypothetical protein CNMCM5793_007911 [Aspergillus hiratsukae]
MSVLAHARHIRIWIITAAVTAFLLVSFYLSTQRPSATTPINRHPDNVVADATASAASVSPSSAPSPQPPDKPFARTVVIAKLEEEDASWVDTLVQTDPHLTSAVYTVDNSNATLTVPQNKGHEVMVYLTYIIDHYASLSDVTLFMHAHQYTWHNNDFLNSDSALQVQRLRSEYVIRNGYINLRCHLSPGCPDHIHPTVAGDDLLNIPEAAVFGNSWLELFPGTPVPRVLSQPCCGQFAVSAERIRTVALERYVRYREWLLATPLEDKLSGRVWEYLWQWLFTGREEYCPDEQVCYCEGYGVCFGEGEYEEYFRERDESRESERRVAELNESEGPSVEEDIRLLKDRIDELHQKMNAIKSKAVS